MSRSVFEDVCGLCAVDDVYGEWSIRDAFRLFGPPIQKGHYVMAVVDGRMIGWASFGYFDDEAEEVLCKGYRKLQPKDWDTGKQLWLVDAIAPYGHASSLMRYLRQHLRGIGHKGEYIYYKRRYPDGRVRIARSLL